MRSASVCVPALDVAARGAMNAIVKRALALPLLVLSMLAGCADPPANTAPTKSAANAPPPPAERFAELSAKDCETWADHFATRLKEATRRRIDECSAKVKAAGGTPSAEAAKDLEVTDAEADRLHGLIIEQCGQQVGAAYPEADAACFVSAKRMEDWKACPFHSMFFSDYKAVAKNHEKMFDDRCRSELNKVAGGSKPSSG
jgi:hypothetical protein